MDLTATDTAKLAGLSRRSVINIYGGIFAIRLLAGPSRKPAGRNHRSGRILLRSQADVFGIFKRSGKVYTEIVPDANKKTLQRIIRGKVSLESVGHSDGWPGYNGLVDFGCNKYYRVQYGEDEFARVNRHINEIGALPSGGWPNLMESRDRPFICI